MGRRHLLQPCLATELLPHAGDCAMGISDNTFRCTGFFLLGAFAAAVVFEGYQQLTGASAPHPLQETVTLTLIFGMMAGIGAFIGFTLALVQGGLVRPLSKYIPEHKLAVAGQSLAGRLMISFGGVTSSMQRA